MSQGIELFVYPVKDIAQAKALYRTLLGTDPYVDSAYYVGFRVGEQEIGLDPHGHAKGLTGPVGYRQGGDIQKSLQSLLDGGAQSQQAIKNVCGGRREGVVKEADGNNHRARQG